MSRMPRVFGEPSWALPHVGTSLCWGKAVGFTRMLPLARSEASASRRASARRAESAESGGRAAAALRESRQNICAIWDRSRTRESEADPGNLPITLMRMFPLRGRTFAHELGRLARGKGWSKRPPAVPKGGQAQGWLCPPHEGSITGLCGVLLPV